jgi:putative membrane protein
MMWNDGAGDGRGGWLLMGLAVLAFWIALLGVGGWLLFSLRKAGRPAPPAQRWPEFMPPSAGMTAADDVLAQRFARGEIDEVEFSRRRALLHGGSPEPPPA